MSLINIDNKKFFILIKEEKIGKITRKYQDRIKKKKEVIKKSLEILSQLSLDERESLSGKIDPYQEIMGITPEYIIVAQKTQVYSEMGNWWNAICHISFPNKVQNKWMYLNGDDLIISRYSYNTFDPSIQKRRLEQIKRARMEDKRVIVLLLREDSNPEAIRSWKQNGAIVLSGQNALNYMKQYGDVDLNALLQTL